MGWWVKMKQRDISSVDNSNLSIPIISKMNICIILKCLSKSKVNLYKRDMWHLGLPRISNGFVISLHCCVEGHLWSSWPDSVLTHWGRVTHICVGKLTIIGSDNGLSPERRQPIIRTNAGILLIGPLETNLSEILFEIQTFSLKKIRLKISSAKCSFRLGLNALTLFVLNWI